MKSNVLRLSVFFVFVIFITTSGFQCYDCEKNVNNISSFKIDISPIEKVFEVGDTIWISTSFDSNIELNNSTFSYDNSNQLCDFDLNVLHIQSDNQKVKDGVGFFEFLIEKGEISSPNQYQGNSDVKQMVSFNCSDQFCEFRIGIVCKDSGYFGLKVWGGGFGYDTSNDCESSRFDNITFNIDNNNFEMCKEIGTDKLFVYEKKRNWSSYTKVVESKNFYFFKVE